MLKSNKVKHHLAAHPLAQVIKSYDTKSSNQAENTRMAKAHPLAITRGQPVIFSTTFFLAS